MQIFFQININISGKLKVSILKEVISIKITSCIKLFIAKIFAHKNTYSKMQNPVLIFIDLFKCNLYKNVIWFT